MSVIVPVAVFYLHVKWLRLSCSVLMQSLFVCYSFHVVLKQNGLCVTVVKFCLDANAKRFVCYSFEVLS